MAEIRLDLQEANGDLPAVCMACGAPATTVTAKRLVWWPRWTYLLLLIHPMVWVIVAMIVARRAPVRAPFCGRHKSHWFHRSLLMWGVGAVTIVATSVLFVFSATLEFQDGRRNFSPLTSALCVVGGAGLLIVWLVIIIVVHTATIRPKVITKSEMVLKGVAEAFVQAVQEADQQRLVRIGRSYDDDSKPRSEAIRAYRRHEPEA
jgi:hypothetical protein